MMKDRATSLVEINGQQYELAPWWQRLRAKVLDWAVVAAILGVPIVLLRLITGHALGRLVRSGPAGFAMVVVLYAMVVVLFALASFYMACGDGLRNGQSYGSRWTGLQVIDKQTGEPCTFQQSLFRFFHLWGGRERNFRRYDDSNTVVVRVPVTSRP